MGGNPVLYPSKVFLGGGGGGGHQNNSDATSGSNGGGKIIIKANTLIANDFYISNNGNDVIEVAGIDAGGGAGAGGSTVLDVSNYVGNLEVTANGGRGGSVNNNFTGGGTGGQCHGTGGGGSGGLIGVTDAVIPGNILPDLFGGNSGTVVNPQSDCEGTSYGASSGQAGVTVTNIVLNESSDTPDITLVDLGPDQSICQGQTIVLDPGLDIPGLWQDGSVQETFTVTIPGTYSFVKESECGNQMDEIVITQSESIELNLPPSYEVCQSSSVEIGVIDNPEFEYEWSNGSNTSMTSVTEPGVYTLTASLGGFCASEASTTVSIIDSPLLTLSGTTELCSSTSGTLTASGDDGIYTWDNGTEGNTLEIYSPGTYTVTLTNAQGCFSTETLTVSNLPRPDISIEGPSFLCEFEEVMITAVGDQGDLLWDDGSIEAERTISQPGLYSVTLTNSEGCIAESAIQIALLQPPVIQVNDADFCEGTTLELTVSSPSGNVSWPGFSESSTIVIIEAGDYMIMAENSCGIAEQIVTVTEIDCSCDAYIPNAFTPDGDGLNDLFSPLISCEPVNYSMLIFNRWGAGDL